MIKTVPSNFIGQKNTGYVLLTLLSEKTRNQIVSLLKDLTSELPGVLWPMPPAQLHITLCEIIQPKPYADDKDILYQQHKDLYENEPSKILSRLPKFTITLDTIECSPQAIIVKSSDASSFNHIRDRLVKSLPLPNETRTPPDIIHTSIARYLKEVDLESVKQIAAQHKVHIEEEITGFKLIKTKVSPLQEYEVIKNYPLA